jgi:hypothetical protein
MAEEKSRVGFFLEYNIEGFSRIRECNVKDR